jgi:hypothetical protein
MARQGFNICIFDSDAQKMAKCLEEIKLEVPVYTKGIECDFGSVSTIAEYR